MQLEIIYQDPDIIVVNKPAGISVHGGENIRGKTLVDFLLDNFPEIKDVGEDSLRPGVVHRLDKNTSGVMVLARNQNSFMALKKIFQDRFAEKKYLALVCGAVKEKHGIINEPIGRLKKNPAKRSIGNRRIEIRGAREAITEYKIKKYFDGYTLVEFYPKTGRTHQIRVHTKSLGHPIACDKVYGGKNVCCPKNLGRIFLHAETLSFSLAPGKKFSFEADPPQDLQSALRSLAV